MRYSNRFVTETEPVCPQDLLDFAKGDGPMRVAIARAGFPLPMQAAYEAWKAGLAEPVFVGEKARIAEQAKQMDWDISAFEVADADGEEECAKCAALLGREGHVSAIMKGHLHTDVFMKALVNPDYGVRTQRRLFHLFYICEPLTGRALIVSDAAVNIAPDVKTRKQMLLGIDQFARALGIARPKIAILSATETPLEGMASSLEARELALWAEQNVPTSDVSGPLALDLILSAEAADIKGMSGDPVAGKADAVLVPEIVSGNVLFKSLVYVGGGCAGGIVLGGKVPILLTSRADPPAARLASFALAAIARNAQS